MFRLLTRIGLGIGISAGILVLLVGNSGNNLANQFSVAQAGSVSSASWLLSNSTLSQAAVKYTHTFTTASTIPANSGRIQIMLTSLGGDFGQFPDFKNVTLGSGTTTALAKQRLEFYPAGQGVVMVINNGGPGTPGTDIAAGTIKIEIDGITNPTKGGVLSSETTTWSGPTQLDTAGKASIEFGSKVMSGKITDAGTGQAIANLPVELHGPTGFARATTDSNGNYSFFGVSAGTYYFEMSGFDPSNSNTTSLSQYLRFEPEQVTIDPNNPVTKNKALTKSSKTITGTVKYADTKKPVVGAMANAFSMGRGGFAFGQTGADGSFTLKVAPGDYFVQVMPAFGGGDQQKQQGQQPQALDNSKPGLFGKLFKLTNAYAQQNQGAQDFFPRTPIQVSFFKGATEEEAVNLGEILVDRADATVKGKLTNPDGSAFKGSGGGGGMGAENMTSHSHIPVTVGSDGSFSFKAKKNSGTWRLNMFDPSATAALPETTFEVDEDTEDLGTIKLVALNKSITVTAKRVDKGNVDQPVTNMPVMAFNQKNPGPPFVGFTDSKGVATIKVADGFEGMIMAMPGGEGGPGKRDGGGGGASKASAFQLFESAYAQDTGKAVGSTDANRLYPVTPPQKVKAGDSVTLKFDLADKSVAVKAVDSSGNLVAENGFVEARPAGSGFDGYGGGFGAPLNKGLASLNTPKGDFVINIFFPPDSDYLAKEQKVTVGDSGASLNFTTAKKTVTITGEVRDASNNNAVIKDSSLDIMVGLFGEGGFSMGRYNPSTGTYTAKWAPDMKVRVGVAAGDPGRGIKKGGYIPNINPKELTGKDSETITHHITLAKVDATIKGVVKDQDGKAVKGITVTADPGLHKILKESGDIGPGPGPEEGPEFGFSAVTDSNGAYEINVAPNKYLMIVNARGKNLFQTKEVLVDIKSKETKENVDISLDKANATVDIEVESGATASVSALASAKVHIFSDDGKTNFISETDSSGKVSVKLPAGTYNFKAGKDSPEKGNSEGTPITKLTISKDKTASIKLKTTGKSGILALPVTTEVDNSSTTSASAVKNGVEKASLNIPSGAMSSSSSDSGSPILTMTPKDEEAPRTKTDTPIEGTGLSVSAVDSSGQQISQLNSTVTGSIAYDESKLPTGVKEDNLAVKIFDEASGQYKVVAFSAVDKVNNKVDFGTTHFSDFAIVATTDTTAPATPGSVKATDTTKGGEIKLTWTNPGDSDFDHVNVYRSTASGTLGDKITATTSKTTAEYTNTGLTDGTTYYYTVRAVDTSSNESTNTDQVSAKPSKATTLPKTGEDGSREALFNLLAIIMGVLGSGLIVRNIRQMVHARNH